MKPPPSPSNPRHIPKSGKIVLAIAAVAAALIIISGPGLNLWMFTRQPTGSMTPEILPGDSLIAEGLSLRMLNPRRGEVVVFKTAGLPGVPQNMLYLKRIIGLPGEHLQIKADGELLINGQSTAISNSFGAFKLLSPPYMQARFLDLKIPQGQYFVVGDNVTNSADSRIFGPIPRKNIRCRVVVRYDPTDRAGIVR